MCYQTFPEKWTSFYFHGNGKHNNNTDNNKDGDAQNFLAPLTSADAFPAVS